MKTLAINTVLILLLSILIIGCNKVDEDAIVPNKNENAFYIDGIQFPLSSGMIEYVSDGNGLDGYGFNVVLYSSGISLNGEDFEGEGDFVSLYFLSNSWEYPNDGTYYSTNEGLGFLDVACGVDVVASSFTYEHLYAFSSSSMALKRDGGTYEIIVEGTGEEYIEDVEEPIKTNIELQVVFQGVLPEYNFLSEEPSLCDFDIDTLDFTFGIDYDHPEKYLVPGEQSDLSEENLGEVRSAIGTPNMDINGIMKVCDWVNHNFVFQNAGGAMAGVNTVDELFEVKTFYGCHTQALIISSILRAFGFPTIMIETVDIQWGYDYHAGNVDYLKGHVMSEVFLNNKWVLFDNNCTYVDNYQCNDPFISVMNSNEKGLFVIGKGVDVWDYSKKDQSFTDIQLFHFAEYVYCYEDLFYTRNYEWIN